MNIALVVPRSYNKKNLYKEYPLGAGYIGTILKNMGNNIKIYDQNVEFTDNLELVKELVSKKYDLIGFSILTATYPTAIEIIDLLKNSGNSSVLFAGGIHPSIFPIDCINDGFDYVIKGEGEIPVQKLVSYLNGSIKLSDVPNIAYKHESEIYNKENEPLDINVNSLPIIDRNLFDMKKYTTHSISGTRGCPFSCKFCCNYNHLTNVSLRNRIRTVESLVEEVEYLVKNFDSKEMFFTDDVFFGNLNKLKKFNELLKDKNLKIKYNAQLRINMITDKICKLLIESGCKKIEVGIETGSEEILKNVCKGISIDDIKNGIKIAKRNGLRIKTNWIYGLPGELQEQYKSIDLMVETMPDEISIHQLIPFPGTEYYDKREKYGINIKNPKDFKSFCYGDLDDNISYDYINYEQYKKLVGDTIVALENIGYISSDNSKRNDRYIYTTPFQKESLKPVQ
ncbi:B12-binding domain-containing radical SAM protein [Clostridium tarantellae]|uniref:Radical SAM protein n=1 Tax=Clostridium tarantellae TaxID=39493 RepID=A0A6I1MJC6_9CLOT|nr:radical SAM protein [Clostridium tarantellae]MPQ42508.1 radical SAM protein [Clostridium tarantellae]